jgi:adenylosuccinate synthase
MARSAGMSLTVVVGGQYGSEGKGKLVSHLAASAASIAGVARCGGPNAGHTADGPEGRELLRQLPSGAVVPSCELFMAAGMQVEFGLLMSEIERCEIGADRLHIDGDATLITAGDIESERAGGLYERIASTLSGTGAAIARKVLRDEEVRLVRDEPRLAPYRSNVSAEVNQLLDEGGTVIVEGTQGFGLSLHHGQFPYVTGRDTTAAGFLSEVGLSPLLVTDVIVVLRTFPIRVGGNSGPLAEITWEEVARRSGYPTALAEYTTVTGRLRRVGEFDWPMAARAVQVNRPTTLAVHGLDYLDYSDLGARRWEELGATTRSFVEALEQNLRVPVRYLFTGPDGADLIDRGCDTRVAAANAASSRANSS